MMRQSTRLNLTIFLFLFASTISFGQNLLSKNISLDVNRQKLENVLEILSNKGDFYFSYSSSILKKDSLVTLNVSNRTVREILNILFDQSYEFKESGNYIIIRKAPIRVTMITNKAVEEDRVYSVSGYVYDDHTGYALNEASVYEKRLLSSALTNQEGYFKLKLKSGKSNRAELSVSKEFYEDTSVIIQPRHSQQLTITLVPIENEADRIVVSPEDYLLPDSIKNVTDTITSAGVPARQDSVTKVELTRAGKFLLSTKQKAQTINLKKFFTNRPFQVGLVPGVSTQGQLSSQVVNNFSLNVLGGYTAGTNGLEVGGLFNIDKKEVRYLQVGGIFNIVGGMVQGVQVAGVNNMVLNPVAGLQVAGVNNIVKGRFTGMQVSGVYNHVTDTLVGFHVAGVGNFVKEKVSGVQVAGVMNLSNREMSGVQIAGFVNYAKRLRGLQIGLINIADSSDGYSIGLINIVLKGYHKLTFSTDEVLNVNAAFKTGNSKLYSILMAGLYAGDEKQKLYSFGYGLGTEIRLNPRRTLTINPELSSQYLYMGSWNYTNVLNKLQLNFNISFGKYVSIFGGPTVSLYISDQTSGIEGYKFPVPPSSYKTYAVADKMTTWFGWTAGINFF